jgi:hypothetical protein
MTEEKAASTQDILGISREDSKRELATTPATQPPIQSCLPRHYLKSYLVIEYDK